MLFSENDLLMHVADQKRDALNALWTLRKCSSAKDESFSSVLGMYDLLNQAYQRIVTHVYDGRSLHFVQEDVDVVSDLSENIQGIVQEEVYLHDRLRSRSRGVRD